MVVDDSIQTEADLEFLASLDERLHETVRYRDGPYRGRVVHCATEEQISVEELERVLDIIKDGDFFFFPGAISWGLETGY